MTKDNSESFKYDGKYLRQGDLIFNLATAALKLNEQQKKIDELERENKKLRGAFHQMKLNSKLLLDLINSLKRSIEINADDAKKWCDEICIKELK